jgi:tetratricopeptide (TPR) repeat protein
MTSSQRNARIWFGVVMVGYFLPAVCFAQGGINNSLSSTDAGQTNRQLSEQYLQQTLGDPKEEAAYQAFHKASLQEADKKIHLGQDFLNKYPSDRYTETVYEELVQTYYAKQDLADFYGYADKGIALFPDDVPLLAMSGWVIPHAYSHDDPDADKKLDKAKTYELHALVVMSAMTKPPGMSDQQFDQFKTEESAIAHSGLGLVYFRQGAFENSVKELQAATEGSGSADPTDLYVLGVDLENLNRNKEAADAFTHCAQVPGALHETCKRSADNATTKASEAK